LCIPRGTRFANQRGDDDLAGREGARRLEGKAVRKLLTIKEEVLAHASNIQAWAEHDYDTRLLHSNIAFPLLKALAKAGDAKAKRVLNAEVLERYQASTDHVKELIIETCADLMDFDVIRNFMNMKNFEKSLASIKWRNIGNMFLDARNFKATFDAYMESINKENASMGDTWLALAKLLSRTRDSPGLTKIFKEGFEKLEPKIQPRDELLSETGWLSYDEGIGLLKQMSEIWPSDSYLWVVQGNIRWICMDHPDLEGAKIAYETAIKMNPHDDEAWLMLGCMLERSGALQEATEAYRMQINTQPEHLRAWNRLTQILTRTGKFQEAIAVGRIMVQKAVATTRRLSRYYEEAEYHVSLGAALEGAGDVNGAIHEYQTVLSKQPGNEEVRAVLTRLGNMLEPSGNPERKRLDQVTASNRPTLSPPTTARSNQFSIHGGTDPMSHDDDKDYHGTMLAASEWAAMMDLERALGSKAIPAVQDVQYNTFGFTAAQGHVVSLGLYKQGLTSLPETIGQLSSLRTLRLDSNKLTSLPSTIGKLKALQKLDVTSNQITSLPETIRDLHSLQTLWPR
jgi:tetratricopeptide (TPR) repeat protein